MKRFVSIIMLLLPVIGFAQQITLEQCLDAVKNNHPLGGQTALYNQSSSIQQRINNNALYPVLNVYGQTTYQNEVAELPISLPGFNSPEIPKLQYRVALEANQLIYDGGMLKAQNTLEDASLQLSIVNNDAEIYKIRERVNMLFFSILLADRNLLVIDNTINDLSVRLKKVDALVLEGVSLPANAEAIRAEILKARQRQTEVMAQKQTAIKTLEVLTGLSVAPESSFTEPAIDVNLAQYHNQRPEYGAFNLIQNKLEAGKKLSTSKSMPKVYGFGTTGFGNPGYNYFKEGTGFFYTIGAKVSWNIWNWGQTKRETELIDLNTQLVENQKTAYDQATRAQVQQYLEDVVKTETLIKSDNEIINLRTSITQSAAAQLENGTMTANDFISEQLAEEQARLNRNLHYIQHLQSKALYKAATGPL